MSSASFSYAAPAIAGLFPSHYPTYVANTAPQIVTLVVFNLPVFDASVRFSLLWSLGSAQRTITPIVPSSAAAIAAATNSDGSMNISFALPTFGAGQNIPVQLLVLPASVAASAPISSTQVNDASLFSYDGPVITGVSVVRARFTNTSAPVNSSVDSLAVPCPFAANDPVWPCSGYNTSGGALLMVVIEVRNAQESAAICPT